MPADRLSSIPADAGELPYVWLTTTGRRSGLARTVELWFVLDGQALYFLAGGGERTHWVRNADVDPHVTVRLGPQDYAGLSRRPAVGGDEEMNARRQMAAKYQGWRDGLPLSSWAAHALCIAVDLAT